MTVNGPRNADKLGLTLSHEHLLIDLYRVYQPHRDMSLHDVDLVVEELAAFTALGGATVVDLTTQDLGRNAARLQEISHRSGLNVIMGTGHYRAYGGEGFAYVPGRFLDELESAGVSRTFGEAALTTNVHEFLEPAVR